MFCEINEGVCFTKIKEMNPEECQTECEINGMKVPSFYDLERFHKFHPPLFCLQKGREHTNEYEKSLNLIYINTYIGMEQTLPLTFN